MKKHFQTIIIIITIIIVIIFLSSCQKEVILVQEEYSIYDEDWVPESGYTNSFPGNVFGKGGFNTIHLIQFERTGFTISKNGNRNVSTEFAGINIYEYKSDRIISTTILTKVVDNRIICETHLNGTESGLYFKLSANRLIIQEYVYYPYDGIEKIINTQSFYKRY